MDTFRAWLATQDNGQFDIQLKELRREQLTEGDLLVRVAYSSLNYKDGLAVTGRPGVIRRFPMVPGIDLVGEVIESQSADFRKGVRVVLTSAGASETHWGGYAQLARVKSEWCVPVPSFFTDVQAAGIGTAGVTAMHCVLALEHHGLVPGEREVVVTGASGGVGSVAVAILAKLGYRVVASTGRQELTGYLRHLGASTVIDRTELSAPSKKPLESERWAAAIDSVGGDTLAGVLRAMAAHGSVANCGLAGGNALTTTVFPFILRGVNLLGIDSVRLTNLERRQIWQRLSTDLPTSLLDEMIHVEPLQRVPELGADILRGAVRGRTVIDVNA